MSWSGIFKFLLGFFIAIALLVGSGVGVAFYFVTKLTAPPPKPIFANDKPIAKPKPSPVANKAATVAGASPATNAAETVSAAQPDATPTTETPTPKPLEPGAYRARVTWRNGLILRDSPGTESRRIGGIGYNQQIVVVTESEDKRWIKIRVEENNEEGWVKAGNVERVESEQTQPATD
ncbi:SH3 domain-containing protein [Microseira sp. BLCC-F43]|jgi:hypothetical protein|uniref:SH3 domain-containing protein n=1 Tax=Microseira sp. BLCC-F43 TaxID=3153602 RepID=UPI0035B86DE9